MSEALAVPRPTPPRFLYWLTLVLVFVTPGQLAYTVDPKHGPFIAYADVLAVLVGGSFVLWALFARALRRLEWPPLALWAWLAVAVLSALGAESKMAAAMEIVQMVLYFVVIYMLFANVLTTDGQRRAAVRVLLAATSLAVLYALMQYATAPDAMAVKSLFGSRTAYAGFLVLVAPLFLGLAIWSELTWERAWAGALVVLGGVTVLSPPLVWVLALVGIIMGATWGRGHLSVKVFAATAAFMLLTLTLLPLNRQVFRETLNPYEEGPIFKQAQAIAGEADAPQGPIIKKRWIEWMPALNMLADNFVLGVGTGNYQLNIGQPQYYGFLPNVKKSEPDTNNLYLVTAGSMGLAGLVCLMAFLGHFWRLAGNLWMHAQAPFRRALACGLYGACVSLLIVNLFTSVFVRGSALAWALVFALVIGMTRDTALPVTPAPAAAPISAIKGS